MKFHAIVVLTLAGSMVIACSRDPQHADNASSSAQGSGGIGAGGSGGAATSASSTGEGGSIVVPNDDVSISLVSPPSGMVFQRRNVDVEVSYSASLAGATIRLKIGTVVVDEQIIDKAETTGTALLHLPLSRGTTSFVVSIESLTGKTAEANGYFLGGPIVTATIDKMYLVRDGSLVSWGAGDPKPAIKDAPIGVVSISEGAGTVFALDSKGHVFVATSAKPSFDPLPGLDDIVTITPGSGHALFLRADGRVFANGLNDRGQLGAGDAEVHAGVVEVLGVKDIVAIAASNDSSFVVDTSGFVHAWGSNDEGQLGAGDEDTSPHPTPLIVPNLSDIIDVAAGRDHVLALTREGSLYAWGLGSSGQLGEGKAGILASRSQPVPIVVPNRIITLGARGNTSYAVAISGELFGWGQNSQAQLGLGDTNMRTTPSPCLVGSVRAIGPGLVGAITLDANGAVWAWGSNASGQLALPLPPEGPNRSSVPVEVAAP